MLAILRIESQWRRVVFRSVFINGSLELTLRPWALY